ncbi:MAG: GNAT family N-acetyltransferase [Pseudomonadota bacterium]
MTVTFREARRGEVPAILDLIADDVLGAGREGTDPQIYFEAFDRMANEPGNHIIVGVQGPRIVAVYQLTFLNGLALQATLRAQLESVRVASDLRGQGIGRMLIADAEARAKAAGCGLVQLTMNAARTGSHAFYTAQGFVNSHVGFKKEI